jgi:hypothetical protein
MRHVDVWVVLHGGVGTEAKAEEKMKAYDVIFT